MKLNYFKKSEFSTKMSDLTVSSQLFVEHKSRSWNGYYKEDFYKDIVII